jgi:8-oxo-dGTP diphosphatase
MSMLVARLLSWIVSGDRFRRKPSHLKPRSSHLTHSNTVLTATTSRMATVICHDIYGNQHEIPANSLQWRPAAYVVMIKDDSVCLLKANHGHYDLPGGAIELGEDPKSAAIREAKEETGLDVTEPTLLGVESSLFRASHSDDRCYHILLMYYRCTRHTGNISNAGFDECEKQHVELAEWVPIASLDDMKVGSTVDFRPYVWQAYKMRT